MAIVSVHCTETTNPGHKLIGHREFKCEERHSDGSRTVKTQAGAKARVKDQIKSLYDEQVEVHFER